MNTSVPLAAAEPPFTSDQVSCAFVLSMSASLPVTLCAVSEPSSFIVKPSSPAAGRSFTGLTVNVIVALSHSAVGSHSV